MKKQLLTVAILATSLFYAQEGRVGINTNDPKTTLDVRGKVGSDGKSASTELTGLQAPRLTREELTNKANIYGNDQKGALIYITDITGGNADASSPRKNVTSVGYYYFDGSEWVKIGSGSGTASVTADNGLTMSTTNNAQLGGTLLKNTDVALGNFKLNFTETATNNGSILVGTSAPTGTGGVGAPTEKLRLDVDGMTRTDKLTVGGSTSLTVAAAHIRNEKSSEPILVLTGTNSNASINTGLPLRKFEVTDDGKVGIAAPNSWIQTSGTTRPTESLDVGGNVRFRQVPSGTETAGDKMMVLASDGTAKLLPLPSPSTSLNISPVITAGSATPVSATYDVLLLDINVPTQTVTLPTSANGIAVGKVVYISQKGSATVTIKPLVREGSHANLDGSSGGTYIYIGGTGDGSWIRASGY